MADSPKCIPCLKAGNLGQTYKFAGSSNYFCHDCGRKYNSSDFEPMAFNWRNGNEEYKAWLKGKLDGS